MARLDGEVGRLLHRLVQRQRMVIGVGVAGLEELMELEGHRHGCASPIGTNSGTARAMLISDHIFIHYNSDTLSGLYSAPL